MARIVDYEIVKQKMAESGFVSLYHNSGAFGFGPEVAVRTVGWIEAEDPSIRADARAMARLVPSIIELLPRVLDHLPGDAWLMPKSHWHYELHFGNRELLESVLADIDIDVNSLRDRNDGSAIAFGREESHLLENASRALIGGLRGSDFTLTFLDAMTLCTIHHHKQLWWQTTNPSVHPILIG
jgi:hypothetical protein